MANVLVEESCLSGIASAIRGKNGLTTTYTPAQMATAITSLSTGGLDLAVIDRTFSGTISNNEISSIGAGAFLYCSNLRSVYFPNCTVIGSSAFGSCSKLKTISVPNCIEISANAFSWCGSIAIINFPNCTSIGEDAFYRCSTLSKVTLPKANCDQYGRGIFAFCLKLTNISLPSLTYCAWGMFQSCSKLVNASLPICSVVDQYAFESCYSLSRISLPSCTDIRNYAFWSCWRLISLYLTASSVCTLSNISAFWGSPIYNSSATAGQFGTIYVPSSLYDTYISSTNWVTISSRFASI